MIVNSLNPEFGYELISVVPYAYWLRMSGELTKTISGYDSAPLYYFSPEHEINPEPRSWYNVEKMNTPNVRIHKPQLDTSKFLPPPYKEFYKTDNSDYHFDIVVCNRYNNEWTGRPSLNRPINYFDFWDLRKIFSENNDKKIAYFNIHGFEKHYDNAPAIDFGDYEFCQLFDNVTHIRDIYKGGSLNEVQMKVMASAKEYYTLNGGYAILASFFGGTNYIYTRRTVADGQVFPRELETGDFGYYHLFGGSNIITREL